MTRLSKRNLYLSEFIPTAIQVLSAVIEDFTKPSREKDLITAALFFLFMLILCHKYRISGPLLFIAIFQTVDTFLSLALSVNLGSILRIAISFTLGTLIITLAPLHLPNRKGIFRVGMSSMTENGIKFLKFYPTEEKGSTNDKLGVEPDYHRTEQYKFFKKMFRNGPFLNKWFTNIAFPRFYATKLNIKANAELKKGLETPIILYVHGLGDDPTMNSHWITDFASNGFTLICPYIKERRLLNEEEYMKNNAVDYKALWVIRNTQLKSRVNIAIDALVKIHEDKIYKGRKIVLMGHSFGGGTIVETVFRLGENQRLKEIFQRIIGVVCLDPWFFPLEENRMSQDLKKPLLIQSSEEFNIKVKELIPEGPIINGRNPDLVNQLFRSGKTFFECSLNCYFKGSTHGTHTNYCFLYFPFENPGISEENILKLYDNNFSLAFYFIKTLERPEGSKSIKLTDKFDKSAKLVIL